MNIPSKMSATLVHSHFGALKFVQFFSYSSFVFGCEPCPWFIGSTIIVVCLCHFNIIVETYDFLFFEFVNGRTKTELSQQISLLFFFLFLFFGGWLSCLMWLNDLINLLRVWVTAFVCLLFKMFRSISSSGVGRMDNRRISFAPIASFDSCRSFSDCTCNMFLLISSSIFGRSANFSDKLSLRAIFVVGCWVWWRSFDWSSSRYRIGLSLWSLSVLSSRIAYGRAFSLFSSVADIPMPKRTGRLLWNKCKWHGIALFAIDCGWYTIFHVVMLLYWCVLPFRQKLVNVNMIKCRPLIRIKERKHKETLEQ